MTILPAIARTSMHSNECSLHMLLNQNSYLSESMTVVHFVLQEFSGVLSNGFYADFEEQLSKRKVLLQNC